MRSRVVALCRARNKLIGCAHVASHAIHLGHLAHDRSRLPSERSISCFSEGSVYRRPYRAEMICIPESWHAGYVRLCGFQGYLCPVGTSGLRPIRYHFINSSDRRTTSLGQYHMPKNVLVLHRSIILRLIIKTPSRTSRVLEDTCYLLASSMASW